MEQARTNIRNRVDAFGVGEPDIVVSGTTIEVQIPGLAQGSIEPRSQIRYCLVGPDDENYGCAETERAAADALAELTVVPQVAQVCLDDDSGAQVECFPSEEIAKLGKRAITAAPTADAGASASPSASPSPDGGGDAFCLVSTTGEQLDCYPTRKEAEAVRDALTIEVTERPTASPTAPERRTRPRAHPPRRPRLRPTHRHRHRYRRRPRRRRRPPRSPGCRSQRTIFPAASERRRPRGRRSATRRSGRSRPCTA